MMVFERKEVEVVDFSTPYKVNMPIVGRCEVVLGGEKMEEVKKFKYLSTVLCKHGEMGGEIRKRAVKGRCVIESLAMVIRKNCVHDVLLYT